LPVVCVGKKDRRKNLGKKRKKKKSIGSSPGKNAHFAMSGEGESELL